MVNGRKTEIKNRSRGADDNSSFKEVNLNELKDWSKLEVSAF